MRRLVLSFVLLTGVAAAQDRPPAHPEGLTRVVGYAWDGAAAVVPPPDSGAVVDGRGRLAWVDPGDGVERVEVLVRSGTIKEVTVVDPTDRAELKRVAAVLAQALGAPDADGFYRIADIRRLNPQAPYLDVAIDAEAARLTYRQPSAPPPAAPPPGQ